MYAKNWVLARKAILAQYKNECCKCGATSKLDIHHVKPKALYPELELDLTNLVPLCRSCHNKEHKNKGVLYNGGVIEEYEFYCSVNNLNSQIGYIGIDKRILRYLCWDENTRFDIYKNKRTYTLKRSEFGDHTLFFKNNYRLILPTSIIEKPTYFYRNCRCKTNEQGEIIVNIL